MEQALSIFLPTWDVDLLQRRTGRTPRPGATARNGRGLLLVTTNARQEIVARCCPIARAAGVFPGMTVAEARALGPARVVPFDGTKSRQAIELLAKWCLRFSPVAAVDPVASGFQPDDCPDGLLVDVTGAAHLFGKEHLLLAEMATRLRRMGVDCRLAIAPTIGAAWALARFGPHAAAVVSAEQLEGALARLPIAALRLSSDLCAALKEVGIEQVRHLLVLPRASLRIRYGDQVLLRLDQAFGRATELLTPIHPTAPLAVCRVFDGAAIQIEAIMLSVQALLGELALLLLSKESGVRGLRIELLRINAPPVSHELVVGRATRDENHLWRLLKNKVETMHLGYGVEAVRITAFWTEAIRHHQLGAWDTGEGSAHDEAFEAFLDTLVNRWGTKRVLAAQAVASHTPEVAWQFQPAREIAKEKAAIAGDLAFVDRPSVLFDHPEPAEAMALQPDHAPSYFRWRGEGYEPRSGQGPERIVTAWWGTQQPSTRDYFKVQIPGGSWLWIFRELESARWFIHGLWA